MTRRFVLSYLLALSVAACSSTEPSTSRAIGVILPGLNEVPVIVAPDTVARGQAFEVVINTFGSSSCTTPAGVSLRLRPGEAHITPFDLIAPDDQACTRDFGPRPHPVSLVLAREGAAEIVVRGVSLVGTVPGQSLVTLRKTVWVVER